MRNPNPNLGPNPDLGPKPKPNPDPDRNRNRNPNQVAVNRTSLGGTNDYGDALWMAVVSAMPSSESDPTNPTATLYEDKFLVDDEL